MPEVDRRTFVTGAAGAGALVVAEEAAARTQRVTQRVTKQVQKIKPALAPVLGLPTFTLRARRREDFLYLRFDFYNLRRDGTKALVKRKVAGKPAYLVVTFVPQHLAERAYSDPPAAPPAGLVGTTE